MGEYQVQIEILRLPLECCFSQRMKDMANSSVGKEAVSRSQAIEEGCHCHYVGQCRQVSYPLVLLMAAVSAREL